MKSIFEEMGGIRSIHEDLQKKQEQKVERKNPPKRDRQGR